MTSQAPPSQAPLTVMLSSADVAALAEGRFVRLDLPRTVILASGAPCATVLVGETQDGLRAYANVCRHQAIPLDARGGTDLGVMSEDATHLLCDSHGALYRLTDGFCVAGPCAGTHLFAFTVTRDGHRLVLEMRP